ncbi:hydroxysqualene dehydroxylase HpnE [Actinocorallia longicatena]|uniref:Hydroxysqualene dehydroxylase HpnE n=1 Tax=Actinocorallia longicatena TaxID=111803 RepID=A0ABP6QE28_9ACTN
MVPPRAWPGEVRGLDSREVAVRRVVVIGGGLAGLASAVWLAEQGDRVTLVERRGRLGGRTLGFPLAEAGGEMVDNGQHVIAGSYRHLLRYLGSVGTREHVEFPRSFGVRAAGAPPATLGTGVRDMLGLWTGGVPGIGFGDLARSVVPHLRMLVAAVRPGARLDEMTVEEWLERIGMPQALRRMLWRPAALGVLNEEPGRASAHALASALAVGCRRALRQGRRAFAIGYPTVDLRTLYVTGAEKVFAERDVEVRLRARAVRVEVRGGRARGVGLADGEVIPADAVIVAVPAWDAGGLLDLLPGAAEIGAAARELVPIPIVSVNLYLDRPIGMTHPWETLLDGDVHWVFDRTRMHGRRSEAGHLYALTTCAAYDLIGLRAPEVVERCVASLRALYPEARDARVVHAHVVPWRKATFSSRPGTGAVRPGQRTAVEGLALAGDWTRNDWPTTMEGAVQSAALAIRALRGVSGP